MTTRVNRDRLTAVMYEFTVRRMSDTTTKTAATRTKRSGGRVLAARLTDEESRMLDELVDAVGENGAVIVRRLLRREHARTVADRDPRPLDRSRSARPSGEGDERTK